ncbi:MAG TPA: AI-2E family transporter, partial [Candidatus Dormibacteraeota bacterium]|nr:AI-2E family transporter [Candidatus Dormibacteraeota bacterium]
SQEFIDVTNQLPAYKKTIEEKVHFIRKSSTPQLDKASDSVKQLEDALATSANAAQGAKRLAPAPTKPLPVQIVAPTNPISSIENIFGPLANLILVTIFTIFMLLGREDLRDRFIRLAGGKRSSTMSQATQALDEASRRINRYLFLQLLVNVFYGAVIGTALYFIGIPNASLWGLCAAVLRFLPYIGPPLAASMPVLLSLAVFSGWQHALMTVALFVVLELLVSNLVEPVLYGAHVGLSALAILVAAVFWTLLWGFPGLVLSTPLTVCLVVLGRYSPAFSFLNILLGDEPVLEPHAQYYQRLLALDQNEARQIAEQYCKDKPLEDLYGSVVIPALSLAEQDRHRDQLDKLTENYIFQSTREIVEELAESIEAPSYRHLAPDSGSLFPIEPGSEDALVAKNRACSVLCIPANDTADEIVALLLCQLLDRRGFASQSIPVAAIAHMLDKVAECKPDVLCISALPPFAIDHARALYTAVRAKFPAQNQIICLWHSDADPAKTAARFRLAPGDVLLTTLSEVLKRLEARTRADTGSPQSVEASAPLSQTPEPSTI